PSTPACSLERVAVVDGARRVTLAEPLLTLRRGAVREGFLVHLSLHAALDGVVTHRSGRVQGLVDVARLDQLPRLVGVVRPDAGEAVCLQLDSHLYGVGFGLRAALLKRVRPVERA